MRKYISLFLFLNCIFVRTLHHYDAIGLLKPTQTTQAGYRLYDNAALTRLQNILMFRVKRGFEKMCVSNDTSQFHKKFTFI